MTSRPATRLALPLVIVAVLVAGGYYLLYGGRTTFRGDTGDASVLLITLDTMRADHLGAYGYRQIRTPVLDDLAARGVLFENAITPAVMTLPSHASILTGTYPPAHGIRNNGDYRLGAGALTLAEVLRARGFRTGAVIGAFVLDSMFGLDQGFDQYDDALPARGPSESFYAERSARGVTDAALRFIEGAKGSRFFLWAHYFDAHHPYMAPSPFREQYASRPYDAEIAYIDTEIGRLIDSMRRLGAMDKTLVVVVGDHGEGLNDHGEDSHGVFVYDETSRVPFIVSFPSYVPGGLRPRAVVSTVDVMPTILDLVRIDPAQAAAPVQGRSLWPIMADPNGAADTFAAYSEAMVPLLQYGWSPLTSIRDRRYRYIEAPRPELYDLTADPQEKDNLASARPEVAKSYAERLQSLKAEVAQPETKAEVLSLDSEAQARLQSLGYAAGGAGTGSASAAGRTGLPDPKDMIPMLSRINDVYVLFGAGRYEAALKEAESILAENPSNNSVRYYLAGSLSKLSRYPEAIEQYRIMLKDAPRNTEVLSNIGWCQLNMERFDDASATFRQVLEIFPDHIYAMASLAHVAFVKGDFPEASRLYKQVLQKEPNHMPSILTLAGMYEAAGKLEEARVFYAHATEVDPGNVDVWMNLGWVLFRLDRKEDALDALEKARAIAPQLPDLQVATGDVLFSLGRLPEARTAYENGIKSAPRLAGGYYGLGLIALKEGDASKAVTLLGDAVELRPENAAWREDLARALAGVGRYGEAADQLEKYLATGKVPAARRDAIQRDLRKYRSRNN